MDFSETILAVLPRESRAKLDGLLIKKQDARAAYLAASDREQEARRYHALTVARERHRLELPEGVPADEAAVRSYTDGQHPAAAALAALRRPKQNDYWRENRDIEAEVNARIDAAKRRFDLALEARDKASEVQQSFFYIDECHRWLNRAISNGGMTLHHHALAAPKTRDPVADVRKLRDEIAELDHAWTVADKAPAPALELKARFLSELDAIAAKGEPTVNIRARADSPVNLAAALRIGQTPISIHGEALSFALHGDAGASFYCWLHRDQIAERICNMIDAAPQSGVLTDDERDREFSRISARRLEVERIEEALIVAAEHAGQTILRRRDADPRAILEIIEV